MVQVNCTAGLSKPATHLNWFINGEPAEQAILKQFETIVMGHEGLEKSTLGLEFRVKAKHFRKGDMKLKVSVREESMSNWIWMMIVSLNIMQCLATIATVYWRSNEESVEGDKPPKTPVLETVYASNSRADRVQGWYQYSPNWY